MSITQILEPSKQSRVIYIAASAIICTAFYRLFQLPIDDVFSTTSFIAVCISGLALILWASRIDILVVEWTGKRRLWKHKRTSLIKFNMACALLYVRPWESSSLDIPSIEDGLRAEYGRILKGREFEVQISDFHQIFWTMFLSIPSFYLVASFFPSLGFGWLFIGAAISGSLIALLLYRNLSIMERLTAYTFMNWLNEMIESDLQRRAAVRSLIRPFDEETQNTIIEMTKGAMSLINRQDWNGFDRVIESIYSIIGTAIPSFLQAHAHERYFRLIEWVLSRHKLPYVGLPTWAAIRGTSKGIIDALSMFQNRRTPALVLGAKMLQDLVRGLAKQIPDYESLLQPSIGLYKLFNSQNISILSDSSFESLSFLPFRVRKEEPEIILDHSGMRTDEKQQYIDYIPVYRDGNKSILELSKAIVRAAEKKYLDPLDTLTLVASWEIPPSQFIAKRDLHASLLGVNCARALWEHDVGYGVDELTSIIELLWIHTGTLDPNRVKERFEKLKDELSPDDFHSFLSKFTRGGEYILRFKNPVGQLIGEFWEQAKSS